MKKILLILIISIPLGCSNKAGVGLKLTGNEINKIPFEQGFILMENDNINILLGFYSPQKYFLTDTNETIRIYIISHGYADDGDQIILKNPKIFYIRVQRHLSYYFMDYKNIILKNNNNKFYLSGNLTTNNELPGEGTYNMLNLSFNNLILTEVLSMTEMLKNDVYYNEIIDENFNDFYR